MYSMFKTPETYGLNFVLCKTCFTFLHFAFIILNQIDLYCSLLKFTFLYFCLYYCIKLYSTYMVVLYSNVLYTTVMKCTVFFI